MINIITVLLLCHIWELWGRIKVHRSDSMHNRMSKRKTIRLNVAHFRVRKILKAIGDYPRCIGFGSHGAKIDGYREKKCFIDVYAKQRYDVRKRTSVFLVTGRLERRQRSHTLNFT